MQAELYKEYLTKVGTGTVEREPGLQECFPGAEGAQGGGEHLHPGSRRRSQTGP